MSPMTFDDIQGANSSESDRTFLIENLDREISVTATRRLSTRRPQCFFRIQTPSCISSNASFGYRVAGPGAAMRHPLTYA